MTQEQWLVYLYGIYPGNGWAFIIALWLVFSMATQLTLMLTQKDDWDIEIRNKVTKFAKTFWVALGISIIGNFIPDKRTFVAIIATPSIVKSYKKEDGKLYKMDLIIDKILSKTVSDLTKNIKK